MAMWLDRVEIMGYDVVFSMNELIYGYVDVGGRPWYFLMYVDKIGGIKCFKYYLEGVSE